MLDLALQLKADLTQRLTKHNIDALVWLTREHDENKTLTQRRNIAALKSADIFLSCHFNANGPSVQATEVYLHPNANEASTMLAHSLSARVSDVTGYQNRGVIPKPLSVLDPHLHLHGTAACLVEPSYISNAQEADRLFSPTYRTHLVHALALSVVDFLTTQSNSQQPASVVPERLGCEAYAIDD